MTYLVLQVINGKCHWFPLGAYEFWFHLHVKRQLHTITCVGDGKASSKITQGGAGA